MATNLVMNVKNALTELPEPAVYGWLDSTVALHWILGKGLLNSHDLRRALRIQAWIRRFTTHRDRQGPLTSEDLQELRDWWIRRVQNLDSKKPQFTQTKNALNLIPNSEGILECRGRIQGMYPVYLPADSMFTRKLVQRIHAETLHGGVSLTMAAVRESYWIPKLRKLVKSVRSTC